MKTLTKSELAALMEISAGKLQQLLNRELYTQLEVLGYRKTDKILKPKIVKFILAYWGYEPEY